MTEWREDFGASQRILTGVERANPDDRVGELCWHSHFGMGACSFLLGVVRYLS